MQWTINGGIYPDVPTFVVEEGDLVKVTVENDTDSVHPMHLHGHHALVLSRDGQAVTGSPWWTDTLDVEPNERYELAFRADNPGLWMDHCHNLKHAAEGLTMHLAYAGIGDAVPRRRRRAQPPGVTERVSAASTASGSGATASTRDRPRHASYAIEPGQAEDQERVDRVEDADERESRSRTRPAASAGPSARRARASAAHAAAATRAASAISTNTKREQDDEVAEAGVQAPAVLNVSSLTGASSTLFAT